MALKPAGQAWVDVQFTYDINGILHVMAENEMGERRQVLLANQALSEAELERYTRQMEKIMLPPIQRPENQKMLACLLAYYEKSTGQRREMIAAMTDRIMRGLNSNRKKEIRDAEEMGRNCLAQLQQNMERREELLFDGELKTGLGGEHNDSDGAVGEALERRVDWEVGSPEGRIDGETEGCGEK